MDVGRTATFNCNVSGNPVGSVVWKKNMRLLSANPRVVFPTKYVVQMRQLKRSDSGMYQCFVSRDLYSAQASARLVIGDLAPKFKTVFAEKTIRPGSYASLACVATGNPDPHIQWKLDGIWPISTRPGILVSSYLSGESVVTSYVNFSSIDILDSGVYTCEAINDAGRISHSRRLNVFGPLFVRPLDNLTALAGASFSVICPFGGYPFETITWKRGAIVGVIILASHLDFFVESFIKHSWIRSDQPRLFFEICFTALRNNAILPCPVDE
ncbi:Down syndrome cell adhesion molecule-like protein Dscam2 [Araneus ventricosus]|uniref:Down syndrome cell adhesion molecule-like protein Dscam2 n=1 Tax=Araneus ventricosus TaxID=182803 RepID=A0A4Y2CZH7_ARAVE|nr:Down syndrome cell adhesion molecule-like protein Dscam2 [Araneus ventricosus]